MNKHQPYDLAQMQSLPLEAKIIMTQQRIRQWYDHWQGQVYVSFSGGKDSTVLKHIVDSMYNDVPALFVNTGLEYPEIQKFVKEIKDGKYSCFNSNVEIMRPEMRFDEVIKKYGYPAVSKDISNCVYGAKKGSKSRIDRLMGERKRSNGEPSAFNCPQWRYLLDAPFDIGDSCCKIMKKKPAKAYEKRTGRIPILGLLANESVKRKIAWMKTGCNAFNLDRPQSQPMAFWTDQDILHYIKRYNVPYCSAYGDIVTKPSDPDIPDNQMTISDYLGEYTEADQLATTGCERTGCVYCAYGAHLDRGENRFQRLKRTHPRQYEYCIKGGEYVTEGYWQNDDGELRSFVFEDDEGKPLSDDEIEKFIDEHKDNERFKFIRKWQPSKEGLGLGKVLDYIGVKYE